MIVTVHGGVRLAACGLLLMAVLVTLRGVSGRSVPQGPSGSVPCWRVDPNHASLAELALLPGIGPVLADRIQQQREMGRRFSRIEELEVIRGIGPRTIEALRPFVSQDMKSPRECVPTE